MTWGFTFIADTLRAVDEEVRYLLYERWLYLESTQFKKSLMGHLVKCFLKLYKNYMDFTFWVKVLMEVGDKFKVLGFTALMPPETMLIYRKRVVDLQIIHNIWGNYMLHQFTRCSCQRKSSLIPQLIPLKVLKNWGDFFFLPIGRYFTCTYRLLEK